MRHRVLLVLITVACLFIPAYAQKRNITEKDLFNFAWIADPQVAPDGSRIAFLRVTVNARKDGYDTAIWTVSTTSGESRQMTAGPRDSSPRWSPDGQYLCFVRAPETNGRVEPPQLFMLSMQGGEAFQFTSVARGAGNPQWSPDGRMISFSNGATAEEIARQQRETLPVPPPPPANQPAASPSATPSASPRPSPEHESDVRVITRAVYRSNDSGYLDFKHPVHIWVVAAPHTGDEKVKPKQLTSGRYSEGNVTWAKDSSRVYFVSDHRDEPYYELGQTDIYWISVTGGQPTQLTSIDMGTGAFTVSPDGKQIAFYAATNKPVRSYTEPDLWVMDLAPNAQPRNLTATYDFDLGGGVGGDNTAPRGGGGFPPVWSTNGKNLVALVGKEGKAMLASFDVQSGKETDVIANNEAVVSFRAAPDATRFALLISTPTKIGDLYWFDRSNGKRTQLTHINDELFSKLNLTEPEEMWYTSFDGKKIQAWIQKPPGFDPNKKYPLILNIHGGPHAAYGWVFDHEFQWMAAKGYVVLYPNPRGSTTYGQDFGNIIQYHYPGDDFKDLMAGVDEVIKRGYIDQTKLGVTGGSGGGLLTDWTVGHTTRFAAAVAQRDIASWSDWWYTADFTLFQPTWFKAAPFDDPDDFKARSPITYINEVKTPMMFILGEADWRTPTYAGGEEFFRALKYKKIPTVMVRFPGETHELSRSGQPWHRIERLEHIVGWFDKWLMGVPKPEYEVTGQ
jgi:dipeptidyl aminopeptidase/acylaminoacyl peptidase